MADAVVWRGPCHNSRSLTGEQALSQLHESLNSEGRKASHMCCAAVMPLPVPLPFPDWFSPVDTIAAEESIACQVRSERHILLLRALKSSPADFGIQRCACAMV
jgi:hypothetical protein